VTGPMDGQYEARCAQCGWTKTFTTTQSCGLQVGDMLYRDADNPNFDRCNKCKRQMMVVTQAPPKPEPPRPHGFWRVPTT